MKSGKVDAFFLTKVAPFSHGYSSLVHVQGFSIAQSDAGSCVTGSTVMSTGMQEPILIIHSVIYLLLEKPSQCTNFRSVFSFPHWL